MKLEKSVLLLTLALLASCAGGNDSANTSKSNVYDLFYPLAGAPSSWLKETDKKGTLETLEYDCHSYALEAAYSETNLMVHKKVNVYLPYGYDARKNYDILYLLHGTDANQDYWLGPNSQFGDKTQTVLNNYIANGKANPAIVVAPTYYSIPKGFDKFDYSDLNNEIHANDWPAYFYQELRNDIIPLVEAHYSSYAGKDVSLASLVSSRDHRAFAGLSRGSMTSVKSAMVHCLDLFSYIGSYSGVWEDFSTFQAAMDVTFKDYPVKFWYNGNGEADFSLDNQNQFLEQVKAQESSRFVDGVNFSYLVLKGGSHSYDSWIVDLANSLQVFFKK